MLETQRLQTIYRGRIAALEDLALIPALEPPDPLLARTVVEAIGDDTPLGSPLNSVIANLSRSIDGFIEVARLKETFISGIPCPNSRETVRLEFNPNRRFVRSRLRVRLEYS